MIYVLIIALVIAADILSKRKIIKGLPVEEKKVLVPGKLELWHRKNSGFCYNMHSGHINTVIAVAGSLTAAAVAWLMCLLPKKGESALKIGLAFSIGGAVGNLYERIFKKKVTDFIFVKVKNAPIFNVADVFIFMGNFIIMAATIFKKRI